MSTEEVGLFGNAVAQRTSVLVLHLSKHDCKPQQGSSWKGGQGGWEWSLWTLPSTILLPCKACAELSVVPSPSLQIIVYFGP